jgi:signal peptidase II
MRDRLAVFLSVALPAALADQGLKAAMVMLLADASSIRLAPFLNLRLGFNTGVSFGMFADIFREMPWLLAAIKTSIVGLLAVLALRSARPMDVVAFALIAGGATGNIIDRLRIGAVVDYIDFFYGSWHWPAFNLADSLIFVGVVLLIVGPLLVARRPPDST